jgi:hypothetical protein
MLSTRRLIPGLLTLAATAAALAAPAAPAGVTGAALPAEAYLLPQDSIVVVGADVHGFFASRLWAQINSGEIGGAAGLTPDKAAEMSREVKEGFAKAMTDMEGEIGFRADRDVDWVFFALRNSSAPTPDGVAVVVGRFDAARIMAGAEAAQAKTGGTVSRKQVGAVTVLSTTKAGKPDFSLAVADAHHLLIGDEALVEATLAASSAGRAPLKANTALAARLRGVKADTGLFVLAGEALMDKAAQGGAPPPVPLPRSASLSIAFDGGTELAAEMASAADAQQAATTLQGQVGMIGAMMAADPDPQKAMAGKMLAGLTVQTDGPTLRIATTPGSVGLGMVAAIAVPALMKARLSANEASAIGDLRTVISGQAAYQSTNGGQFGELPCLSAPATCIKGYSGPNFLEADLTSLADKNGYRRAFHPGKRGTRARSLQGFAYTAVPVEPGKTGARSFCAEASGVIKVDPSGAEIKPVGGVCPAALEILK